MYELRNPNRLASDSVEDAIAPETESKQWIRSESIRDRDVAKLIRV